MNKKISGYKTWECSNKKCKSKLVLNNKNITLQEKSFVEHIHEPDSTIDRQDLSNNIKRNISESNIRKLK